LSRAATEDFIDRYGSRLDAADMATLREVAGELTQWQLCRKEPLALVHGDFRPDNLMFSPDGSSVVAIDWQTHSLPVISRTSWERLSTRQIGGPWSGISWANTTVRWLTAV
jgi:aminoglycoside/choline kinase family phosphotransferase